MDAGISDFFYAAQDGLRLHARVYGAGSEGALPVICLAGLTRNARDFHELALFLSRNARRPRKVVAFDYRGRGESARDPNPENYTVSVEARDVLDGLAALGICEAAFIGTSRGGLILHVLAMMQPSVLKAVILNDIGPVLEAEGMSHIRAYLDGASQPETWEDAVRLQRAIHGPAFPALTDRDWDRFARAIYRDDNGRPVADFDPLLLAGLKSLDLAKAIPDLWPQFEALSGIPLMAIRGEHSRLLSVATLEEMARRHPGMEALTVQGQGHAPLLETGDLPERIAAFIEAAE